jgi:uncharacterized protein
MTIDLGQLAREVELPVEQVQTVVELLDAGNTVPFVACFRRDQTSGLDETQLRRIQDRLIEKRRLADRKDAVLRAIESQGKLSEELKHKIEHTYSIPRLEDLFLPYKPKKPTLGSVAKDRGLEPLAREILHASPAAADLDARAADFVNPDRELASPAEVLLGVGHFLAEHFSEQAEVRSQLRKIFSRTARVICKPGQAVAELKEMDRQAQAEEAAARRAAAEEEAARRAAAEQQRQEAEAKSTEATTVAQSASEATEAPPQNPPATEETAQNPPNVEAAATTDLSPMAPEAEIEKAPLEQAAAEVAPQASAGEAGGAMLPNAPAAEVAEAISPPGEFPVVEPSGGAPAEAQEQEITAAKLEPVGNAASTAPHSPQGAVADHVRKRSPKGVKAPIKAIAAQALARKKEKEDFKRRRRQRAVQSFREFFDAQDPIKQVKPKRVIAMNRGERLRVLEVTIEPDVDAMQDQAIEMLVTGDHPHRDFLQACVRDAVVRLIIPSLAQEARRDMNDDAELYAIKIYTQNLRSLLLQKPIRGRRILAIEPNIKKGCKIAAVDEGGRVLGVGILQIVGRDDWRRKGRERLLEIIQKHHVTIVAIGDSPGARDVERIVTDLLEHDLKDAGVEFTIVPEAGVAAYGTSPLAREELSKFDPSHRVAISIARRLLDPLAELVKVGPANIEVGPAHYDVKSKLLRDRLDAEVESIVCQVGVDVNRANPALLRYVAGMNQLTARRLYEFREHYGPLQRREQLKDIPGIDEKIYRQVAGFMKIAGGENPLDATWIHPESYEAAHRVLQTLGLAMENVAPPPPKPKAFAEDVMAESPPSDASGEATVAAEPSAAAVAEDIAPPADAVSLAATGELPPEQGQSAAEHIPEPAAAPPEETAEAPEASHAETAEAPPAETTPPVASQPAISEAAHPTPVPPPAEVPHNDEVERRSADWNLDEKAQEFGIGRFTLQHILTELTRPGRDLREELPGPLLRARRLSLRDMEPGMELKGIVTRVVDFGAFVDVGLSDLGLIHISQLANRYVRDPRQEVSVGDAVRCWVVEVDKKRHRVSLTAIEPGTERAPEEHRERPKKEQQKRERPEGQGQGRGGGDRPPRGQRRDQGKKGPRGPRQPSVYVVQSKKPAKPISKKMIEGKEPLRSFSDLQQFMQKKQTEGEEGETPAS